LQSAVIEVDVIVSADASEDDGKVGTAAVKENENVDSSTDSSASSAESSHKRQLSVREKAAAFLENTTKDSVC